MEIFSLQQKISGKVKIPGSKSFTNRALVMASLCEGQSKISGFSESEDSRVLIEALRKLGVEIIESENEIVVRGAGGKFREFNGEVNLGMAGTSMRFFTSVACLVRGKIVLRGEGRMLERPIADLVEPLRKLGAEIKYLGKEGCPPIEVTGIIKGGKVAMKGTVSSQYFTSLLLIAPVLDGGLEIEVQGEQVSKSYVDMTIAGLKSFTVKVENDNYKRYTVKPEAQYQATDYIIEGDASGASYFWAIAAVTGSRIRVKNIDPNSLQGDAKFPDLLGKMGCKVRKNTREKWIEVEGPDTLQAITVDMESMPDTAQTLAVIVSFAKGKTKITGLANLKEKETDRLAALRTELEKMGIKTEVGDDYIVIEGGEPKGAEIETYNDHRMAMAFAVAGTRTPGVKILNPGVVKKSFPGFWEKLESVGVKLRQTS